MQCPACGARIDWRSHHVFCSHCGERLEQRDASASELPLEDAVKDLPARSSIGDRNGSWEEHCPQPGCPQRTIAPFDASPLGCDYHLVEMIGSGGMGTVYLARQTAIHRLVALKRISEHKRGNARNEAAFLSEALITAKLDHPNIIPIHDMGVDQQGSLFYAMRLVRGKPWSESLATLGLERNLDILLQVCDAIAYAHAQNLIHRDLKPDNVMLGDFGEVLVTDWGLAAALPTLHASVADRRMSCGSPAYMAPEMAWDDRRNIGKRTDVYLLGAVLHELLTGLPPHPGETVHDAIAAAAANVVAPPPPRGELGAIARRAMATMPEERYGEVGEFQQAVRTCRAHQQSERLATDAVCTAAQAEEQRDYQLFSSAIHAFEEALVLWPGNGSAMANLANVRREYARCAFAAGDFDLAESQLRALPGGDAGLRAGIAAGRRDRARHAARVRLLTRAALALTALLILALGAGLWQSSHQRGLILAATHERDRAEAQLVRLDDLRLKRERRSWESILHEDLSAAALPGDLTVVSGAWAVSDGQLRSAGEGPSVVMLGAAIDGDVRIRFERATARPLSVYLGIPQQDVAHRLDQAQAAVIRFGTSCRLCRGGLDLAVAAMPMPITGLMQHLTIVRDGRTIQVLVDGHPLLSADVGTIGAGADPRLVFSADPEVALEDIRVEILHDQQAILLGTPPAPSSGRLAGGQVLGITDPAQSQRFRHAADAASSRIADWLEGLRAGMPMPVAIRRRPSPPTEE